MNGTLNKVMLIGFLGDDIKMHYFDGGNCIGRFQLATKSISTKLPMKDHFYRVA
jgi:single-strand DNA-binding protein